MVKMKLQLLLVLGMALFGAGCSAGKSSGSTAGLDNESLNVVVDPNGNNNNNNNNNNGSTVGGPLIIRVQSNNLVAGGTVNVNISGGAGTYTLICDPIGVTTQVSTGSYTYAIPTGLTAGYPLKFTAMDSDGLAATATLTLGQVYNMTLSPLIPTVAPGGQVVFTAANGAPPYTWQITGGGALSATSGETVTYTAPATTGSAMILVTDSVGNTYYSTITIK